MTYSPGVAGRIAVVDEANRFARWEERRTIHVEQLVHRSAHIVLFDTAGRLLVQRRHRDKQTYPRYWDVSCAGHVEESDYTGGPDDDLDAVYEAVAHRELMEELGVTAPLQRLARLPPEPGVHYEQIHLFRGVSDGPYTLQADEVEEHRMLRRDEVVAFVHGGELLTHTLRYVLDWLAREDIWHA